MSLQRPYGRVGRKTLPSPCGEHAKSVLKSVAIFLDFGHGNTSILHSVAAVYVLGIYVRKLQVNQRL